jgi:hypothetical protein
VNARSISRGHLTCQAQLPHNIRPPWSLALPFLASPAYQTPASTLNRTPHRTPFSVRCALGQIDELCSCMTIASFQYRAANISTSSFLYTSALPDFNYHIRAGGTRVNLSIVDPWLLAAAPYFSNPGCLPRISPDNHQDRRASDNNHTLQETPSLLLNHNHLTFQSSSCPTQNLTASGSQVPDRNR